jgi:2-oxoisovalerate dehydrogenase E1 component
MSTFNRAQIVDENFLAFLKGWRAPAERLRHADEPIGDGCALTCGEFLEMFESQMMARHLDLIARVLRARDAAFYTIGSAGHEANVAVGRLTRVNDPAFLHYRSGAFMMERSRKDASIDPIYDSVLSQVACAEDPIAGGRHKVWGSRPLWVLPQTSTIASHLPKAVGSAMAIARGKRLGFALPVPADAIVVCSFGDASLNHSTATGAINAAAYAAHQSLPVPVLFVCEDNGIGISVNTAPGWIEATFGKRDGITYFSADGLDLVNTYEVTQEAVDYCRKQRQPTFLHLKVIRLLGHAGTDFEAGYRSLEEIAALEAEDPLLHSATIALESGAATTAQILEKYESIRQRTREAADRAVTRPRLNSAAEVMAPLAPYHPERVAAEAARDDYSAERIAVFGGDDKLPEHQPPRHLNVLLNRALHDLMAKYPQMLVFGEDVARKGGVYNVTAGLHKQFRGGRTFNTLLDEQTIFGLAQGLAYMGMLPVPEIQYLAYFHNACDQIRGEACSTQFFSNDQFRNPMVIRIASLGYQKGFGGHFHNDNSIAALRDIPGLVIACPARGDDAVGMLRTAMALAAVDGRVVAFLEPIALYMTKDLYQEGDGAWQFPFPPPGSFVPLGEGRVYGPTAGDVLLVSYGNGVLMSLNAAKVLQERHQVHARVLDLRWINPLNTEFIVSHARACGRVLVVDEGRRTGGVAEAVITAIVENAPEVRCRRVTGEDTYIPLGPAANHVLPSTEGIIQAVLAMRGR